MAFSPLGNLLFTGGKDGAIRVWDLLSGISLKTVTSHLAEVTSLQVDEKAQYLLSASKDNSNRLWDIRTGRSVQRYKGHLNTSKNFIGCCFGSNQKFVAGGSEDGKVYLWDTQSGHQLSRLSGHSAVTFDVKWNSNQGLLASCSQDGSVKLWWFDPQRPKWHK
jgi:WD40 repeat protein